MSQELVRKEMFTDAHNQARNSRERGQGPGSKGITFSYWGDQKRVTQNDVTFKKSAKISMANMKTILLK